jgi:iron complex outermembrane receptor protein
MRHTVRILIVALFTAGWASDALAQVKPHDLAQVTLEDLLNIEITSASRKEQRASDTAAAVFVITQDDIRRSGMRTLPELFRLVPGMQVAQINANNWAVSARGFNDLWSNKLLVLVDGRSIYTRQFSGVLWNDQDLALDDIDRIEVVRGPGGAVWGANAVNGVINIVTKSARETKGASAHVSAGSFEGTQVSARYGGTWGATAYRVHSQWSGQGTSINSSLGSAGDGAMRFTNGFRTDWTGGADALTTEGSVVTGSSRPLWTSFTGPTPSLSGVAPYQDATVAKGTGMARWIHTAAGGSSFQVQSSGDLHHRDDGNGTVFQENVLDVDAQFHAKAASRHDVVVGGGYREVAATFNGSFIYSLNPAASRGRLVNLFAQDEVALTDRLALTLGSKVERDTIAGWGIEPTVRLIMQLGTHNQQHLWGGVSRARRTPSVGELSQRINYAAFPGPNGLPIVLGLTGNPDYQAEHLVSAEGGYRLDIGSHTAFDVAVFHGHYTGLPTNEPMAPVFETTPGPPHLFIGTRAENLLHVHTQGVEVSGHWTPVAAWRLDGSYTAQRLVPEPDAGTRDAQAVLFDGNTPTAQWQLHSSAWLGSRVEVDGGLYHVGALRTLNVAAYTRADARAELKISSPVSLVVNGQNLFDRAHAEYATTEGVTATLIPRSVNVSLVWRY